MWLSSWKLVSGYKIRNKNLYLIEKKYAKKNKKDIKNSSFQNASASAATANAAAANVVDVVVQGKKRPHDAIEQEFLPLVYINTTLNTKNFTSLLF